MAQEVLIREIPQVTVVDREADTVIVEQTVVETVTIGIAGPIGPAGPQGAAGAGVGVYRHTQGSPSAVWTIVHNLNGYVAGVRCYDLTGAEIEGVVEPLTLNSLRVLWNVAVAGTADVS